MTYHYDLARNASWHDDFAETYSVAFGKGRTSFTQEDDCIRNAAIEGTKHFEYISLAHKKCFTTGAKATLVCSFEKYGAPLITLANSIGQDENGYPLYGDHYEIVAYESGCNVWFITKAPEGSGKTFIGQNLLRLRFPIADGEKIELSVATGVKPGFITVELCGNSFDLPAPDLAESFRFGFTACEGINRLYSATIEE